ncbi:MAG: DNA replication/repair protein RecF [Ilumatobacteraceae bacterium]
MIVERLQLANFRIYESVDVALDEGVTAIIGDNGQGKTSLAEAIAYLTTLKSFRGVPADALIRNGCDSAIIRAEIRHADGREVLIEAEISRVGRNRTLVNKQRLQRSRDLLGVLRATVFSPDDLDIVKGAPALRRDFLDDAAVAVDPTVAETVAEVDRILRQRNTLLRQAGGRVTSEVASSLDVRDARFAEHAAALGEARARTVALLAPLISAAYEDLARQPTRVDVQYEPEWRKSGLLAQLHAARNDDVRRGTTTIGPHRDELELSINGVSARTHSSQGEQRTLALAMRLAVHREVHRAMGTPPVLVLDDVLSELDPTRAAALLEHVPEGQVLITSAGRLPDDAQPRRTLRIKAGQVVVGS